MTWFLLATVFTVEASEMVLELGQSSARLERIHVTPDYSNAVLAAALPHISDAAERLDLPVLKPVRSEHVVYCSVMPDRTVGVEVGIEGGWVFVYRSGYVTTMQGPHSYYILQNPGEIPQYFGTVRMSTQEAIQLARDAITRLGIPLASVFAEQEPRVTEPVKIGTNTVPHYRIQWLDPRAGVVACVDIDVNGDAKRVERMRILSKSLERPPPRLAVDTASDLRSPRWPLTNPDYAWKLIPIALRAVDEYGHKLSLPIPRPLTTNDLAKFSLADNGGWPHCEIELTRGWRFIYRNSMVNGYYAPDNFFNSGNRPILIKEFAGKPNITEQEAVGLVRKTMKKFGYPRNLVHMDFEAKFLRPALPGIPRLFIFWHTETEDDLQSKIEAEVDLNSCELKSLYYDDKAYWKHPPAIDVPISLPRTNTADISRFGKPRTRPTPPPGLPHFKRPGEK